MKRMSACFVLVWMTAMVEAKQASVFYFSVDIGSDKELSDPNKQGDEWMDPGDIYDNSAYAAGPQLAKDDAKIFGEDPPPCSPAGAPYTAIPIGCGPAIGLPLVSAYFDMDGEDQLNFVPDGLQGQGGGIAGPIVMAARPSSGLFLNPDILYVSYDDDGAPGWWANSPTNVPTTISPDRGTGTNEVLMGVGWHMWLPVPGVPTLTEAMLGLADDPPPQAKDDDVDALDTRRFQYWFWTCDHEATFGYDPGDIYVTDTLLSSSLSLFITHETLELPDGVDIDGFEFCVTDDTLVLQHFGLGAGNSYFAVAFSVDDDDPTTVVNESGGLNPGIIYLSLLNGVAPMPLCDRSLEGDVDAIAFEERDMDFGDAPGGLAMFSYPTLRISNGAGHVIKKGVFLGAVPPDAEDDGQPSLTADLDEATLGDEDRFGIPPHLVGGYPSTIQVLASTNGYVNLWIDANADGDWSDAGERIATDLAVTSGVNFLNFTMPSYPMATTVMTYLRLRYCTQTGVGVDGIAPDGEVEDYRIRLIPSAALSEAPMDFGDAPDSYQTRLASDGARHVFNADYGMGPSTSVTDAETDGQPNVPATGDDLNGVDDEDGIVAWTPLVRGSNSTVRVETWSQGFLSGWVDFNRDGVWTDPGERIFGPLLADVTNAVTFHVPLSASVGDTYARVRFTSYSGAIVPYGLLPDGEVEDRRLTLFQPSLPSSALAITNIAPSGTLTGGSSLNVFVQWTTNGAALYRVDACTNLMAPRVWTNIVGMPISAGSWNDVTPQTQRFYRVVAPYTYP